MCEGLLRILDGHWVQCPQCERALTAISIFSALALPCVTGLALFNGHVEGCPTCVTNVGADLRKLSSFRGPAN
jgi:hypothetical protein